MNKNILVIKANPDKNSFGEALANEYIKGAKESGNKITELYLEKLKLENFIKTSHKTKTKLTSDLIKAQQLVKNSDHIVFAYPIWWGTIPALLKEFIEIIFDKKFAYVYSKNGLPKGLLKEKSARLLVTMNSPPIFYKLFYKDPNWKLMKKVILNFCGISPVKKSYFGSVKMSNLQKRKAWLKKAYEIGLKEF